MTAEVTSLDQLLVLAIERVERMIEKGRLEEARALLVHTDRIYQQFGFHSEIETLINRASFKYLDKKGEYKIIE